MTAFFEWSKKAVGYRNPHPHFYEIKISRTAPSPNWRGAMSCPLCFFSEFVLKNLTPLLKDLGEGADV